ncbi:C4-dicarboxylate transporter DcuC [Corynebacterium epidermidicanis]|uniref:C4-dicarboxylate anaerobic carrier family protein n=1 Tax=Corynebacterium epidermidicanis TaxID=1050174 RepID=A0A0G3GRX9_9CORY|nr:C4-dicarboxylate transporter DcuC [Corynebacterium epidermidicanis]AKK02293.1 c4-dicarboxylate anaerobic carrier family protein [Corynebacterium epidermidicanis]
MLYLLIAGLAVAAVIYLIVKKVNAAASIFFVGVILLMVAAMLGKAQPSVKITPSGNSFYDELLVVEALFKSRFSGIGMAIMVLFGFVAYMRHIGADAKAVVVLSKPLQHFEGSYWMVPIGYLIGSLLSLVVPSASALSLLLIATLLPALIAAGLTPLTVGAIVVTSSTIIPTPLEAGLIQGAKLTGLPISEFVFGHVARATVPTLVITAFVHMWWQHHCDKVDAARSVATAGDSAVIETHASVEEALQRAKGLPGFYAILPLLPLLLIVLSAILKNLHVIPFEAEILPVTVASMLITLIIEVIRHRDVVKTIDSTKSFFTGMGEGAAGVVALLVAAAVLIEGITQLGIIDMLIRATEGSSGAAVIVVLIFVAATAIMATLTGSGTAPYFAFAEVVPKLAAETGIQPVQMLNAIWGTSNLMRQVSPVNAAVLIVSGAINVNPIRLVKRTAVPMIVATILNVVFTFLFIAA